MKELKEITPTKAYRLMRELLYEFNNAKFYTLILESPIEFLGTNTVICGMSLSPLFSPNKRVVFYTQDNRRLTKKDITNPMMITLYNETLRTIKDGWKPRISKLPDILQEHLSDPFGE